MSPVGLKAFKPNVVINHIPELLRTQIRINKEVAPVVAAVVRKGIADSFATKTEWPSTLASKRGRRWRRRTKHYPHPLLVRTGNLRDSFKLNIRKAGAHTVWLEYTSYAHDIRNTMYGAGARPYAHYHQYGTDRMPARPFLPTSTEQFYAYVMPKLRAYYKKSTLAKRFRGRGSRRFLLRGI